MDPVQSKKVSVSEERTYFLAVCYIRMSLTKFMIQVVSMLTALIFTEQRVLFEVARDERDSCIVHSHAHS